MMSELRTFLFMLVSLLVLQECSCKNVLFIVVDDLRPDLGCYRGLDFPSVSDPPIFSPNIDALASKSILFKRAHVQQALCSPSRTSFLTSRRPDTTLVYDLHTYFRNVSGNFTTIPQYFKDHGRISVGMGKIFHTPEVSGGDDPLSWSLPYHRPLPSKWDGHERSWNFVPDNETETDPLVDMQVARRAISTLRDFARGGKYQYKPFFMAVGFKRPHLPFVSPSSFSSHYPDNEVYLPHNPIPPLNMPTIAWSNYRELRSFYKDMELLHATGTANSTLPDNKVLELRKAYYSAVSYVDAMIGSVLDELKRLNLDNNTIISLIGDHGYQLGEHGLWCKTTNFELATHAPMMIRIPGLTDQGIETESMVEMVDLFPTLVEASGLPKLSICPTNSTRVKTCTEGESLMPLISNPDMKWKNAAFSQFPRKQGGSNIMGYTIRTDKHRYTEWPEFSFTTHTPDWSRVHGVELYDHTVDPDENVNRADDPAYSNIRQGLRSRLHSGWRSMSPSLNPAIIG